MVYNGYNLFLKSNFEIRIVKENASDVDLFIPLTKSVLNICFIDLPPYLGNKFQCLNVFALLFRIAKAKNNNTLTLHVLKNIDLNSSILSFELNYEKIQFDLSDLTYYSELRCLNKES